MKRRQFLKGIHRQQSVKSIMRKKEQYKRRAKEYKERTNYKPTQEQRKEYNKNAYLRRKEKMKKALENEKKEEKKDDI